MPVSKPFTLQKLGLALLGLLPLSALHAQSIPPQQALEKILAVRGQWAGPGFAPADLRLSSAYADANGLEHMYVQQLYQGIPVFNKIQSLAFLGGRLASHTGAFVPAKQLAAVPATPAITAAVAVSGPAVGAVTVKVKAGAAALAASVGTRAKVITPVVEL